MLKWTFILLGLAILGGTGTTGCVPKKKLTYAQYQRDSLKLAYDAQGLKYGALQQAYDSLFREKNRLADEVLRLNRELEELRQKYEELSRSSTDQAARYDKVLELKSKELNQKSAELKQKENLLAEREQKLTELQTIIDSQTKAQQAMLGTLRNALAGYAKDELSVEVKNGKIYVSLSDKLLFRSGSADVDPKGKEALKQVANALKADSTLYLVVEGHTDTDPIRTERFADNWDLSAIRATNVVRILSKEYGMAPQRLTAEGRGQYYPVAPNDSKTNKALNRRTDLVIAPRLDALYDLLK